MPVIDLITFNALKETTGADFIGELIDSFVEDTPEQIANIKTAIAAQDAESFRRAAHTVKSNAATFGANELAALARELEMMGRDGNFEAANKVEVLQEAFDQARIRLNELR
jgi:HPt (histidine-containing phosphotransfer) domain-containing protein